MGRRSPPSDFALRLGTHGTAGSLPASSSRRFVRARTSREPRLPIGGGRPLPSRARRTPRRRRKLRRLPSRRIRASRPASRKTRDESRRNSHRPRRSYRPRLRDARAYGSVRRFAASQTSDPRSPSLATMWQLSRDACLAQPAAKVGRRSRCAQSPLRSAGRPPRRAGSQDRRRGAGRSYSSERISTVTTGRPGKPDRRRTFVGRACRASAARREIRAPARRPAGSGPRPAIHLVGGRRDRAWAPAA